jgi:hypothetical protein
MEKQEKVFADGFIFKRSDNAPDWVVGNMSVKVEDAIAFLQANAKNGWVNLKINAAKSGKFYMELDTWESKAKVQAPVESYDTSAMEMAINNERHLQANRKNSDLPF